MTNYNFIYSYSRELIEYSDDSQNLYYQYNINNIKRIDSANTNISLPKEILNKISNDDFIFYAGYDENPSLVKIIFENELTSEQQSLLDTIVSNHKNNVPDKYGVWYQDAFVEDPENPGQTLLFDTEELAESYITDHELNGAIPKGVVIL